MGLGGALRPLEVATCWAVWPEALGAAGGGVFALGEQEQGSRIWFYTEGRERRRAADGSPKLGLKTPSPGKGGPQALTSTQHQRTGLRNSPPGTASSGTASSSPRIYRTVGCGRSFPSLLLQRKTIFLVEEDERGHLSHVLSRGALEKNANLTRREGAEGHGAGRPISVQG